MGKSLAAAAASLVQRGNPHTNGNLDLAATEFTYKRHREEKKKGYKEEEDGGGGAGVKREKQQQRLWNDT